MKYPLLALLAAGPAHGYELKQSFERRFGAVWPPVNIGQIYSTLGRLERDGLVHGSEVAQSGRPAKHVFELTDAGRTVLSSWIEEPSNGPRIRDEFFLKLVLCGLAGAVEPLVLIERQRFGFLQQLRDLHDLAAATRSSENAVTALLIEGATLHLQADIEWLDLCEETLRERGTI